MSVNEADLDKQFTLGDHNWVFINLGNPGRAAERWNSVKYNAIEVYQWVNYRPGMDSRLDEDVFNRFVITNQVSFRIPRLSYLFKRRLR